MGAFHRRVGAQAVIDMLKANDQTADAMEKTAKAPYLEHGPVPVNADA